MQRHTGGFNHSLKRVVPHRTVWGESYWSFSATRSGQCSLQRPSDPLPAVFSSGQIKATVFAMVLRPLGKPRVHASKELLAELTSRPSTSAAIIAMRFSAQMAFRQKPLHEQTRQRTSIDADKRN